MIDYTISSGFRELVTLQLIGGHAMNSASNSHGNFLNVMLFLVLITLSIDLFAFGIENIEKDSWIAIGGFVFSAIFAVGIKRFVIINTKKKTEEKWLRKSEG